MRSSILLSLVIALLGGCADEPAAPGPAAPAAAVALAPSAAGPSCPCWDAEALMGALPEADACVDQSGAEVPFLSVDLFDPGTATQTQAFTRYDGGSDEGGSCRLAVVGTAGLVNEIAAVTALPRADYEGCAALLAERARATAAGC